MSRSELVDVEVLIMRYPPSGLSVVVKLDEDAEDVVLPLSAIEIMTDSRSPYGKATVTMLRAFAEDKGLI